MADKKISQLTSASTPLAGTEVLPIVQSGTTVKVAVSDLTAGRSISSSALVVNTNTLTANTVSGLVGIGTATPVDTNNWSRCIDLRGTTATNYSGLYVGNSDETVRGYIGAGGASGSGIAYVGTASNDPFQVYTSNTLRASWDVSGNYTLANGNLVQGTVAKGINFTANTPAAGMTSQLLNWYEEGTFTPTIVGTTSAGTGTYSAQTGRYTRTGNRVYINLYLSWSAHTGTGNMRIDGLPFTSANVSNTYSALSPYISALTLTAGYWLQPYIGANKTSISLEQVQAGASSIAVPMDTSAEIIISGFYEV